MVDTARTRRTFVHELWRAGSAGIIETAGTTFLLLIAVRYFQAGPWSKAIVAAGGSFGLIITPVVVACVTSAGWRTSQAAAAILALGAAAFTLAALWTDLPVFVLGTVLAMTASSAVIPLLTQMFQENYPESQRGRLFSRTVMVRIAVAAVFGKLAGDALTGGIGRFPALLLVFAAAMLFAALCLSRCPTHPIKSDGGAHPLRSLRFAREDALFRRTLTSWMILGFANLMMLPMRIEYMANPVYGWQLSVATIALFTTVIPNVARLLMSPLWGYLFDRMNFFALRIILNLGFAVGILSFFLTDSMIGMAVGAVAYGISNSGGDVAWSLWVTKFSPPDRVADYMSVHTFLTGIRGVLAPLTGFLLAGQLHHLGALAAVAGIMILVASLMLLPELRHGRSPRSAAALHEEIDA
jgi:MFS family permease